MEMLLRVFIKSNTITECLKGFMKYHGHNLDQTKILVTVSTEKAATGINGNTVHFAFNLPVCKQSLGHVTLNH